MTFSISVAVDALAFLVALTAGLGTGGAALGTLISTTIFEIVGGTLGAKICNL